MSLDPNQARQLIFAVLEEQLANPATPEVRVHFDRLIALGIPETEVRIMIASELISGLTASAPNGDFSYPEYVKRLEFLPASYEDEYEDDDLMEDDYFIAILFEIEGRINEHDRKARARGIVLTDSQVRSILNKVRKHAGGSAPKVLRSSERDQVLAVLYDDLLEARKELTVMSEDSDEGTANVPTGDWVAALRRIEESVRTHTGGSGSRGYLDYLESFLVEGGEEKIDEAKE